MSNTELKKISDEEKEKIAEAKKELREYRENIKYIREKQEDVEEIRQVLVKTTTRISPTKTSNSSMSTDKFSDGLDRIDAIERDKDKKLAELLTKKWVIDEKIDKLEYPYRDVLFMRYARGKSWNTISQELDYELRYIHKIHSEALFRYIKL